MVKKQIINIAVSTQQTPEIADYPDSKKFGVLHFEGVDEKGRPKMFRFLGREEQSLDCFDGE